MKKKLVIYLTILLSFFIIDNVKAASASISISPTSKTVIVGNSFNVTVIVSSSNPIAALEYTIQYDSSILSLSSTTASTGGTYNLDYTSSDNVYKKTYTYTFKAKKSGTATISISGERIIDANSSSLSVAKNTSKINVMTQSELEATYSKNNNLSSLLIEGYELDPVFDKNTTEYKVTLKPETEKINILATKEDNKASIIGIGEVSVTEGLNVIKVEVTAQNGNIKTYTINATVEELDPINIKLNDKEYTVVRNKKNLDFKNPLFSETTTNVLGSEVPAFYNEITKTTLVALKDNNGIITFFRQEDNNYYEFNEIILGNIDLMVLDTNDIPYNYISKTFSINDKNYNGYSSSDTSRFITIYGVNLETGNKGFYLYDNLENSLQRFDIDTLNMYKNINNKNMMLIYVLIGSTSLFFITTITLLILKIKGPKKINIIDKKEVKKEENNKETI